ncbi:hypothetical protein GCM10010492_59950 [Saccharothrix mutabilis subsp. mutabilis]|uniref:Uncharacterized protein n=1 Tax=Saccharothrix mutabilis subsp. mutabilis TaxID=66855 RepID=A0ABP3E755_9PSEU
MWFALVCLCVAGGAELLGLASGVLLVACADDSAVTLRGGHPIGDGDGSR